MARPDGRGWLRVLLDAGTEAYIQFAALRSRVRPVSACGRAYAAERRPFVRGDERAWQADHEEVLRFAGQPQAVDACAALFAKLPNIARLHGGLSQGVLTQEGMVCVVVFCRAAAQVGGLLAASGLTPSWWRGETAHAVLRALGLTPAPEAGETGAANGHDGPMGLIASIETSGPGSVAFSLDELPDTAWRTLRSQLERVRVQRLRAERAAASEVRAGRPDSVADLRQSEDDLARQLSAALDALLRRAGTALLPYAMNLRELEECVGRLDELCARVRLSREAGYTWSELCLDEVVLATAGLPDFPEFTPLDLALDRSVSILTGPNMGGKSVAQKTLALALASHQYGYPVFAGRVRAPLFAALRCIGGDDQSLGTGLSSFGAELVRIREAFEQRALFLCLDEPARATNPEEGRALVTALAAAFAQRTGDWLLLATHFHVAAPDALRLQVVGVSPGRFGEEAAAEQAAAEQADGEQADGEQAAAPANAAGGPLPLDERMRRLARAMDYRIVPATSAAPPRTGLAVARWLGLPETVVQMAERILDGGEQDGRQTAPGAGAD